MVCRLGLKRLKAGDLGTWDGLGRFATARFGEMPISTPPLVETEERKEKREKAVAKAYFLRRWSICVA